jgi:hypothetical protein
VAERGPVRRLEFALKLPGVRTVENLETARSVVEKLTSKSATSVGVAGFWCVKPNVHEIASLGMMSSIHLPNLRPNVTGVNP